MIIFGTLATAHGSATAKAKTAIDKRSNTRTDCFTRFVLPFVNEFNLRNRAHGDMTHTGAIGGPIRGGSA
jgi:hypothetical protein